jgi:dUTP pyrophosphatase
MQPKILFQALKRDAVLPKYGTPGAIGADLFKPLNSLEVGIFPGERILIKTGLAVAIPDGYYGRIAPRSGWAHKAGIDVLAGVIDSDYRGEIGVILINHGEEAFAVRPGDRIAQLIFECADRFQPEFCQQLPDTSRGDGGFGSTGA